MQEIFLNKMKKKKSLNFFKNYMFLEFFSSSFNFSDRYRALTVQLASVWSQDFGHEFLESLFTIQSRKHLESILT